jgi:hypothetical protein
MTRDQHNLNAMQISKMNYQNLIAVTLRTELHSLLCSSNMRILLNFIWYRVNFVFDF